LQVLSNYLRTSATVLICVAYFGLTLTGQYGLSIQVIGIASGMAAVWTAVKWPRVMQLRSAQKVEELRGLLWPRAWLQVVTFVLLTACAAAFGPQLLELIGTDKVLLPTKWLLILAGTGVLELTYVFWGTLLAAENRVPTLWSTVATNIGGLVLAVALIEFTSLGLFSLVIAPLLSGSLFLYWYWPSAGARSLGMTWWRFMFSKPSGSAAATT
jgi:O-antigen/teichoic acid export membrane protein